MSATDPQQTVVPIRVSIVDQTLHTESHNARHQIINHRTKLTETEIDTDQISLPSTSIDHKTISMRHGQTLGTATGDPITMPQAVTKVTIDHLLIYLSHDPLTVMEASTSTVMVLKKPAEVPIISAHHQVDLLVHRATLIALTAVTDLKNLLLDHH